MNYQRRVSLGRRVWRIRDENSSWVLTSNTTSTRFFTLVLELIRNAVGSAQMLMSQKVQQFFRLCQQSVVSTGCKMPSTHITYGTQLFRDSLPPKAKLALLQNHISRNFPLFYIFYISFGTRLLQTTFHLPSLSRTHPHTPSPPLRTWQACGTCSSST